MLLVSLMMRGISMVGFLVAERILNRGSDNLNARRLRDAFRVLTMVSAVIFAVLIATRTQ